MTADQPADSLTRRFTDLLAGWTADDPALQERCRLLLLDGLAVAALGVREEPGPRVMGELARQEGAAPVAHVIGMGFETSVVQAARVNGMSMHVLDFEPMWLPPNHALSPMLPAVLALAEKRERAGAGPQGAAVLRAVAVGIEAQGRLRLASGQLEPAKLTLHPPGAVGPVATAVACGVFLGLDGERLAAAAGIAASRCGGLLANVGSMTKALHCGDGAAHGVEAAMLAEAGFTANADALGSPRGWGKMLYGPTFDPEHLIAPIGKGRALEPGPSWKLFPSQFATHFAITAALEARAAAGARLNQVRRMVLRVPPMPYIDRPQPVNGLDGKFSWQYTAAVALLDGAVGPASFHDSRRFAPDVQALLDRTVLVNDPTIAGGFDAMEVEAVLEMADGPQVTGRCTAPLGSWTRPVPSSRIVEKARGLLTEAVGAPVAERVIATVMAPGGFSVQDLLAPL